MPTPLKVLAVVPDGNVMDRLRIYSQWNVDLEWHLIMVRPDAALEPTDWVERVHHLQIEDRSLLDSVPEAFPDLEHCQYERACHAIRDPFVVKWPLYDHEAIENGILRLRNKLMAMGPADLIVTWGERCWYNEVAIAFAQEVGVPVCRLERATFPGTIVADGTGLEQGRTDLPSCHRVSEMEAFPYEQLETWLSIAVWQSVEQQQRTTRGMVEVYTDNRPTVFVPLQVPFDTNIVFRSEGFGNFELLEYVAAKYKDCRVLVKVHPGDAYSNSQHVAAYCADKGWELLPYSSQALIAASDLVVSINSQCIIEAWMHAVDVDIIGKPAFDLPEEPDKQALLYTLRFAYYIEPWQLTTRLSQIRESYVDTESLGRGTDFVG